MEMSVQTCCPISWIWRGFTTGRTLSSRSDKGWAGGGVISTAFTCAQWYASDSLATYGAIEMCFDWLIDWLHVVWIDQYCSQRLNCYTAKTTEKKLFKKHNAKINSKNRISTVYIQPGQWRSNRACKVSSACGPIAVGGPKQTMGGRGGPLPDPNLLRHWAGPIVSTTGTGLSRTVWKIWKILRFYSGDVQIFQHF